MDDLSAIGFDAIFVRPSAQNAVEPPGASHFCSPPLEIGVRSQESGARKKEEEGRRKEPEEVFLHI
ncbi:hypothetical protein QT972_24080 [Microcoleus sp. herbarium7]|uniref:hypothetical protein n=1 Tax=Microcoleus sp. herbarium7 TaxID=3055435 RepID=UPI002FD5A4F8